MLDVNFIRQNPEEVKRGVSVKNADTKLVDDFLAWDDDWKRLTKDVGDFRAQQKKLSQMRNVEAATEIKEKIRLLENELKDVEKKREEVLNRIPNLPAIDVPVGKDESENKVIRKFKEPTKFNFEPKDHMELGTALGLIDTEKAAKVSGARFNYLFKEAALLQFALIKFVMDTLTDKKTVRELAKKAKNPFDKLFVPVIPPDIIKAEIMKKMDRFDPIEDRYYLEKDDSLLAGSAEHALGPLHMDEIIDEKDLPIRYVGYSTAFRREAGSYGKDTAGILRRHQFDKAEIETFIQPEYGQVEQDFILAIQEYMVGKLDIPYQVVMLCTGDMGKPDFRQMDIECWMPGQNKYRETHTSDYMTDYQSRRLNTRLRRKDGSTEFVHMNDATAFAIGRILIAILENYQQKDGSILVPKALRKYMGIRKIDGKD